jgi:hypothetical protein
MIRASAIGSAAFVLVALLAGVGYRSVLGAEKHASGRPRTTVVNGARPTVIVFAPPEWARAAGSDEGTVEMLGHIRFAVGDVNKCKGAKRIAVRMVLTDRLAVNLGGKRLNIDLAQESPDVAGAYLFRPGRKPCAITVPNDTAFLGDKLSQAVGEFFEVPGCLQQGWPTPVCPAVK